MGKQILTRHFSLISEPRRKRSHGCISILVCPGSDPVPGDFWPVAFHIDGQKIAQKRHVEILILPAAFLHGREVCLSAYLDDGLSQ